MCIRDSFGAVPEEMRDAALYLESLGVSAIDINMGCPVRKVVKTGGGSAMMTELPKTQALVRGMVDALNIPVTAKMRLGWDDANITAPDLARALADAGCATIFIHGRTRAQGFEGTVKLPQRVYRLHPIQQSLLPRHCWLAIERVPPPETVSGS